MKVVLMHDWLTGFRGGERVLEAFCEMFPEAPLYTLIHKKGSVPESIENRRIHTSFLNSIPGIDRHYRKFLPLFPLAAQSLKIQEKADLVLSSSHCVIKGVKKPKGSKHISYIHSPMRYLYDQYDSYFGQGAPWYQRAGMKLCRGYLTRWDIGSNENVDVAIANSKFVQKRITTFYSQESDVINPFVDLADFSQLNIEQERQFYLMVTAFAPNKKVEVAIEAFNRNGKTLKIIGSGQKEGELRSLAKENIQFLGNLGRREVIEHFSKAKAFIFPGVEDFGITPLESLACGTPVIAYKVGGVLETLNDQVSHFFEGGGVDDLTQAINEFESKSFNRSELVQRANDFSKDHFIKNIESVIENTVLKN